MLHLQFLCRADDVEESKDVADAGEAGVSRADGLLDAEDDSLRRVGLGHAVNDGVKKTQGTIGTVAF